MRTRNEGNVLLEGPCCVNIQPIVEGHGDVLALPVLLRRLISEAQTWDVGVGRPIRRPRTKLVQEAGVMQAVRVALEQRSCGGVLVVLDGNSDCPAVLGPTVQAWATAAAKDTPCRVVLAHREYEAWFLAAMESLRGFRGVREDAQRHPDPEVPRGAKAQLEARMRRDASYLETADQPALTARFSLSDAYRRSRSFRKLIESFGSLVRAMGEKVDRWPPAVWERGT